MQMKIQFERKPDSFVLRNFIIEETVSVSKEQFEQLLCKPQKNWTFIEEHKERMFQDTEGVYHCMLIVGEGRTDGLLVNSEGSSYARYAAYVPETAVLQYPSLAKLNHGLIEVADAVRTKGAIGEMQETWLHDNPALRIVFQEMMQGIVQADATVIGNNQAQQKKQCLRELIRSPMENLHLIHKEIETVPATIIELSDATLTSEGKHAWSDVLDAPVCRVYSGYWGLQVELEGISPSRLEDFSYMLAGYCSDRDYRLWVADEDDIQAPEMKM